MLQTFLVVRSNTNLLLAGSAALTSSIPIPEATQDVKLSHLEIIKAKPKRKAAEKTPSPPKRQKVMGPLLIGPLDPQVHVADCLQFNLTPEERVPFKGMTPSESLNMAYELIARASVCLNYAAGTTKPLLVAELETATHSLNQLKKENATLTARIEELTKPAEDDRVKAKNALDASQKEVTSLQLSVDTLQSDLQKAMSLNDELLKDKNAALAERDDLLKEKSALEDQVCQERELGFNQGIGQCIIFSKPS